MPQTKIKKRKGFTLIELVICVAIVGILALMVIPQFNRVTDNAKLNTFKNNCQVVSYAIIIYQAEHNGDLPLNETDLDPYINGGWGRLFNNPSGSVYQWDGHQFTASYTTEDGVTHNFAYPD